MSRMTTLPEAILHYRQKFADDVTETVEGEFQRKSAIKALDDLLLRATEPVEVEEVVATLTVVGTPKSGRIFSTCICNNAVALSNGRYDLVLKDRAATQEGQ